MFERRGEGSFQLLGPAPDWLPAGSLTEAFPFLEVFLPDAEEFWASPGDRTALHSDLWTQPTQRRASLLRDRYRWRTKAPAH